MDANQIGWLALILASLYLNECDQVQQTLCTEAMAAVIRRNREYINIGLQKRAQEVLDAFGNLRDQAAMLTGSVADRITDQAARQNQD